MHHFIYSEKNTFITSISGYEELNFGLNEVLSVGSQQLLTKITEQTQEYSISSSVNNYCVQGFSGSIVNTSLSGSVSIFSGGPDWVYFSSSLSGSGVSGSIYDFSGEFLYGFVDGIQTINKQNIVTAYNIFNNRALLQFDLTSISQSISSGIINLENSSFFLKMKVAKAENIPVQYSLYAYPVIESWDMGNGYFFDGGSCFIIF